MTIAQFRPVLEIVALSVITFLIHWMVFQFVMIDVASNFQFSLITIYTFFGGSAILITLISIIIKQVNIDSVGQGFLLTTFIKMFICFGVFYPKLNGDNTKNDTELPNFIIVFLLFLAMETYITIRILNKKQ